MDPNQFKCAFCGGPAVLGASMFCETCKREPKPAKWDHVTLEGEGRVLLGDVREVFRDAENGVLRLRVTYFNGEPWPIEPRAYDVFNLSGPEFWRAERKPVFIGSPPSIECSDPTCSVCGEYLSNHWRGRECLKTVSQ